MKRGKGVLITFEGTEGSGKSTQIRRALAYLKRKKRRTLLLREPGGTRVSEKIRKILLDKELTELRPETELFLYLAARAQIVREKIIPALEKGTVVICDRYEDSTIAYQGYGRGISPTAIRTMGRFLVRGNVVPELTFLLDIDPRAGMKRGGRHDRMERQSMTFHHKVRKGFLTIAAQNPHRFVVINALKEKDDITRIIRRRLERVLR